MPATSREEFYRAFAPTLEQGEAALFAGAGLSRASGFADWKELLAPAAQSIGLEVQKETDLLRLAQYYVNAKGNRNAINQLLMDELTRDVAPSPNHELIARLPLQTVWTTNYDTLLETAFRAQKKRVDVKLTQANLATALPRRDVTVYKMHGDIALPHEAVLTKADYESYNESRSLFLDNLRTDLLSKTFLFLGFSFSDPNLDYVLGRLRVLLGEGQRQHYCVMRTPADPYERTKLELQIQELRRYSIQTVVIDDYAELTGILKDLNQLAHRKDIFVSGSTATYEPLGQDRLEFLAQSLGREIVRRGYNLVSGLGPGIGTHVLSGALTELYGSEQGRSSRRTVMRPFPREVPPGVKEDLFAKHRRLILEEAGIAVFLSGNKSKDGVIELGHGVVDEFKIAKQLGLHPIPVGATGHAARQIWTEVMGSLDTLYAGLDVRAHFEVLGREGSSIEQLVEAVFAIISKVTKLGSTR